MPGRVLSHVLVVWPYISAYSLPDTKFEHDNSMLYMRFQAFNQVQRVHSSRSVVWSGPSRTAHWTQTQNELVTHDRFIGVRDLDHALNDTTGDRDSTWVARCIQELRLLSGVLCEWRGHKLAAFVRRGVWCPRSLSYKPNELATWNMLIDVYKLHNLASIRSTCLMYVTRCRETYHMPGGRRLPSYVPTAPSYPQFNINEFVTCNRALPPSS